MELVILDGLKMTSRQSAHDVLKEALQLPEYYGGNLDALWDCISTMQATVEMVHAEELLANLGLYGQKLLSVLEEADSKNPDFHFSLK